MGTLRSRDLVDRNDQAVAGVVEIEEPEVEFMNKRLNKPKGCPDYVRASSGQE